MFLGVSSSAGTRSLQIRAGLVATLAGVSCYYRSSLAISQSAFSVVVTDFCFVRFLSVLVLAWHSAMKHLRVVKDIVKVATINYESLQYDEYDE